MSDDKDGNPAAAYGATQNSWTADAEAQRKAKEAEALRNSQQHGSQHLDSDSVAGRDQSNSRANQNSSNQPDAQPSESAQKSGPFEPWGRVARFAAAIFAVAVTAPFIGPAALLVGVAAYNAPEIANGVVNVTGRVFDGLFGKSGSANITPGQQQYVQPQLTKEEKQAQKLQNEAIAIERKTAAIEAKEEARIRVAGANVAKDEATKRYTETKSALKEAAKHGSSHIVAQASSRSRSNSITSNGSSHSH